MNWSGGLQLGSDLWSLGSIIAPLIKLKSGIDILEQRTDGAPNTPITRYIDLYPMQSLRGSPRQGLQLAGSESPEIILERMIRDRMVQASVVSAKNDPLNAREDGETIYEPTSRSGLNLRLPNVSDFASFEKALGTLGADRGKGTYAAWLPATVLARVQSADGDARVYSFIGNRAYVSHDIELNSSSKETSSARLPANDTISIYHGVIGDRPDLFLDIPLETKQGKHGPIGANEFFQSIAKITNENHREALKVIKDEYGVLRNSSKFWPFYDWMHRWMVSHDNIFGPGVVYAGVLDLMQYDPPYELNHQ